MGFPGPSAPFVPHIRNRKGIREDEKTNPILYFCEKRTLGVLVEKCDARAGNEWDCGWANARGRLEVYTCFLYDLKCIYVSMMNGRNY